MVQRRVLEAVHSSRPIRLGSIVLGASLRVPEMLGQVLIAHPWLAALPVGFTEHPAA
jgi:hypothetical protein